jgi:outer membrane biosynthesis protein TonB
MKVFFLAAAAAFLMTSTAHAGSAISFEIDGQRIHIAQPKGCNSLSCMEITAPGLSSKSFNLKSLNLDGFKKDSDDDVATATAPATPQAAPAPSAPTTQASQSPAPAASVPPPPPPPAASDAAPASAAQAVDPPSAPQPTQHATTAPTQPAPAAAPSAPTTPIGVWATEENKGNVRIEQCGANLCGYAEKTGERILINMKPENSKWVGRIHDPNSGGNYDSTIAMKSPNALKVQGCAFGGMFCGGQTWKRVS